LTGTAFRDIVGVIIDIQESLLMASKNVDPTSRMTLGSIPKIPENQDSTVSDKKEVSETSSIGESSAEEVVNVVLPGSDEAKREYESRKKALSASIKLEEFYFTGKITHEFTLKGDFKYSLEIMDSGSLETVHKLLWDLLKEHTSDDCISMAHSKNVLARSLVKYGKKDLSSESVENRLEFINKHVPGIIIPVLMDKYSLLEVVVSELFKDENTLKN
jgi:hypothetical protein